MPARPTPGGFFALDRVGMMVTTAGMNAPTPPPAEQLRLFSSYRAGSDGSELRDVARAGGVRRSRRERESG